MALYVEGLSDCLKRLDKMPQEIAKDVESAGRKAGSAVAKEIRAVTPARWRKLVRSKVARNLRGETFITSGLFNKGEKKDAGNPKEAFDWFKAYWANYGTLTKRDPNHQFTAPIKGGTAAAKRRNNVGQAHQNWFENARDLARAFQSKFEEELRKKGYEW